MKNEWERNANFAAAVCGAFVDWDERFYECPECGEPIYECDWTDDELKKDLCPICGYHDEED